MCTAATYKDDNGFYFGRTLDYEFAYGEEVTVVPRNYAFKLRHMPALNSHYSIIGMAHVAGGYPLFYDAVNEHGLGMAGLNFVGNAYYPEPAPGANNIAQFELIPYVLGKCRTVREARALIETLRVVNTPFSDKLPTSSLHWIIADEDECIVLECVRDGMKVYDNPTGVMTNNPPFDKQLFNLNNYMALSNKQPANAFSAAIPLATYSRGMGALGLPGDLSSMSRFVRAAFVRANSISGKGELAGVSQFFHILNSVDQQRGCCEVSEGKYEITIYTSCCDAYRGIYYYTTYENHQITGVDMHKENLDGAEIARYPLTQGEHILMQN